MSVVLVFLSLPGLEDPGFQDWKLPKEDATSQKAVTVVICTGNPSLKTMALAFTQGEPAATAILASQGLI